MLNAKTRTDYLFEEYLKQRNFAYEYEPTLGGSKLPDFLITTKDSKKILVECKEIEQLPVDKIHNSVVSIDLKDTLKVLRRRIDCACEQLKPYRDKTNFLIVIIGKKEGWTASINELYWAMFGDPVIKIPLHLEVRKRKAYSDLKINGSLRRNDESKNMFFRHNYIGGVGLIKSFNGLQSYKDLLFDKYYKRVIEQDDLNLMMSELCEFMENGWKKYEKFIPNKFLNNSELMLYKVELVINPLSRKSLPTNVFNGEWDEVKIPSIVETLSPH